jgi:hypothetical protein
VSTDIDAIPTIDDGEGKEDGEDLHKLEDAFAWVIHECYLLLDKGKIHSATVAEVEIDVKR